jgi:hypothetical protein
VRKPAQLQSAFPGSSADAAENSPTVKRVDPPHRSAIQEALRGSGQERVNRGKPPQATHFGQP